MCCDYCFIFELDTLIKLRHIKYIHCQKFETKLLLIGKLRTECQSSFTSQKVNRSSLVGTLGSFKLQFSLGFVTSCYVIMNISIA